MLRILTYFLFLISSSSVLAQFSPPAGTIGSTAIHKDSSVFVDWAKTCVLKRGFKNISKTDSGFASVGNELSALDKAGDANFVSLGDGGSAILSFSSPVYNGLGYDFAVFENSFDGLFLELAHVEVSSDGQNFYRFKSTSNTDTSSQVNSFGLLDATKINNLAGKYKANYGTPFDLDELSGISGLDIMNITHIKIIDVVGSINPLYCSRDGLGRPINDPWPTEFGSGGFDLDGVGIIYSIGNSINEEIKNQISIYPTNLHKYRTIHVTENLIEEIIITDITGKSTPCSVENKEIKLPNTISNGLFTLKFIHQNNFYTFKIIITD
jgi:hypothetical protein